MKWLFVLMFFVGLVSLTRAQESYTFKYSLAPDSDFFYLVTITAKKKDMLVSALNLYTNSKIIYIQDKDEVTVQLKHKTKNLEGYNFTSTMQLLINTSVMRTTDILQECNVNNCMSTFAVDNKKFNLHYNSFLLAKFRGRAVHKSDAPITLTEPENLLMFQLLE
jgi:hypothetical protein